MSPPGVAASPDSRPDDADPAVPLLTPDDDLDEVRLILDSGPEPPLSDRCGATRATIVEGRLGIGGVRRGSR